MVEREPFFDKSCHATELNCCLLNVAMIELLDLGENPNLYTSLRFHLLIIQLNSTPALLRAWSSKDDENFQS